MAEVEVAPSPVVEAPTSTATPDPVASVSEHEQRYGPNGTGDPAPASDDDSPLDDVVDGETAQQQRMRGSRAKSKMAAARINKLTAEKLELRQRIEALEKAQKAPSTPAQSAPQPGYRVPPVPAGDFSEPEPQLNDFADKEDPYGAWQRALARWDRRKDEHESMRTHQQAHVQSITRQEAERWRGIADAHNQKLVQAIQQDPNVGRLIGEAQRRLMDTTGKAFVPPVLDQAILLDSDSVAVAVFLASRPEVLDELVLLTAAQPVNEQTVAITRRLLRQRMTAGTTGSVAPSQPLPNTPKPPNPVRTGSIRTGAEPPGEGSSIAEHAKFYGPKARR